MSHIDFHFRRGGIMKKMVLGFTGIEGNQVNFAIDPQNEIVESDEGNNTVVLTVP